MARYGDFGLHYELERKRREIAEYDPWSSHLHGPTCTCTICVGERRGASRELEAKRASDSVKQLESKMSREISRLTDKLLTIQKSLASELLKQKEQANKVPPEPDYDKQWVQARIEKDVAEHKWQRTVDDKYHSRYIMGVSGLTTVGSVGTGIAGIDTTAIILGGISVILMCMGYGSRTNNQTVTAGAYHEKVSAQYKLEAIEEKRTQRILKELEP